MHEGQLLLFLVQLLVVLGLARLLGEISRRFGQPPLVGEILAGLLLGASVLGNLAPGWFSMLFPDDPVQLALFDATAQLGILFLLLVIGLEVDVASAWKLRRQSLSIAITGVLVPLALGTTAAWFMYETWAEVPATRPAFSLLVGAAVSITAITVVARLLLDLRIAKSDLGLLLLSAMAINDLLGWAVLAMVLSLAGTGPGTGSAIVSIAAVVVFTGVAATFGRSVVTRWLQALDARGYPSPAAPLSTVVCLGLACGVLTASLGIHPVFGFLVAGLMAGDHHALSEHTRSVITQMVESVFVPLYFAGICLHVDFVEEFSPGLVLAITLLSVFGKYGGAWLGTLASRIPAADRVPIAIAHIPGGSMGVLLAAVARDQAVIGPQMFVAIVFASIASSVVVGPALAWALHRRETGTVADFLSADGIVSTLEVTDRFEAIDQLSVRAARLAGLREDMVRNAVRAREDTMDTGVGGEIAVPHARFEGLSRPVLVFARHNEGLDWNAIDDKPVHFVFLILTPAADTGVQLEILSAISRGLDPEENRAAILRASNEQEIFPRVREALTKGATTDAR
ncbi:MAG: cation:proton antiporter [Candidatus Binatia bacterium]|nr:cation:proton antiporter [Candidatus Binatia bacterium]